jgi:hypothetical protein
VDFSDVATELLVQTGLFALFSAAAALLVVGPRDLAHASKAMCDVVRSRRTSQTV